MFDLGQYIAQIFSGLRGPAQTAGVAAEMTGVKTDVRPTNLGSDDAAGLRTSAIYGVRG